MHSIRQNRKFWRSMIAAWFFRGVKPPEDLGRPWLPQNKPLIISYRSFDTCGYLVKIRLSQGTRVQKQSLFFVGYADMCSCLFKESFELWMRCTDRKCCDAVANYANITCKEAPSNSDLVCVLSKFPSAWILTKQTLFVLCCYLEREPSGNFTSSLNHVLDLSSLKPPPRTSLDVSTFTCKN